MPAEAKTIANLFLGHAKGRCISCLGAALFAAFIKTFKWGTVMRITAFSALLGGYGPRGDL